MSIVGCFSSNDGGSPTPFTTTSETYVDGASFTTGDLVPGTYKYTFYSEVSNGTVNKATYFRVRIDGVTVASAYAYPHDLDGAGYTGQTVVAGMKAEHHSSTEDHTVVFQIKTGDSAYTAEVRRMRLMVERV